MAATNLPMSLIVPAPRRSLRILEKNSAFCRFPKLPKELQIQIWEHAIIDTIDKADLDGPEFGKVIWETMMIIYSSEDSYVEGCVHNSRGPTNLLIPKFFRVMQASRLARLVACQWWLWVLKGCTVGSIEYPRVNWEGARDQDVDELVGIIEELEG